MKKFKLFLAVIILLTLSVNLFAAWDATQPDDDELLADLPAILRANWAAIALGTDPALQITNAKVATAAAIDDSKLATINDAGKVDGAALTGFANIPAGAGVIPDANSNGKLKADASDTTPGFLDSLISSESFQVNASDQLEIKDEGIQTEMLEGGSASPSNDTYYGKNSSGTMGFHSVGGYAVKANSADASPGFLDAKINSSIFEIDAGKITVKSGGIGAGSIANGGVELTKLKLTQLGTVTTSMSGAETKTVTISGGNQHAQNHNTLYFYDVYRSSSGGTSVLTWTAGITANFEFCFELKSTGSISTVSCSVWKLD